MNMNNVMIVDERAPIKTNFIYVKGQLISTRLYLINLEVLVSFLEVFCVFVFTKVCGIYVNVFIGKLTT